MSNFEICGKLCPGGQVELWKIRVARLRLPWGYGVGPRQVFIKTKQR
jgi:hypothetical protein